MYICSIDNRFCTILIFGTIYILVRSLLIKSLFTCIRLKLKLSILNSKMAFSSFNNLQILYEEELYTNAHTLAEIILSNLPFFHLSTFELFSTCVINADSLYEMKHYREAHENYERSLHIRRQFPKDVLVNIRENEYVQALIEKFSDIEIRFKMAKWCLYNNCLMVLLNTFLIIIIIAVWWRISSSKKQLHYFRQFQVNSDQQR